MTESRPSRKERGNNDVYTSAIRRDDHDLITFAIRWAPYGGGPQEDIFITFGMTPARYVERLREAVHRQLPLMHPKTAELLLRLCGNPTPTGGTCGGERA